MSRLRHLEVLARLRRIELDASRRSLANAACRVETCHDEITLLWAGAGAALPASAQASDLHLRNYAIDGARRQATRLAREIDWLEVERDRLARLAGTQLLACRQVEIFLEEQRKLQREDAAHGAQTASDEHAAQARPPDLLP